MNNDGTIETRLDKVCVECAIVKDRKKIAAGTRAFFAAPETPWHMRHVKVVTINKKGEIVPAFYPIEDLDGFHITLVDEQIQQVNDAERLLLLNPTTQVSKAFVSELATARTFYVERETAKREAKLMKKLKHKR